MDHPFRSAMVGGFHRQDVLEYLEHTSQEAAKRQQELEQSLDEVRTALTGREAEFARQQEELNALRQETEELRAQLERANLDLDAGRAEWGQKAEELEQARREAQEWKERATALEPNALAYAAVKERTAGVELEAHRRAQEVQEQALQQAGQLRRQMEQWMQKVGREYDALRSRVESTVSHAADELDKAGKCLEQVTLLMEAQDLELEALTQNYGEADPAKVAAPMPLEEK